MEQIKHIRLDKLKPPSFDGRLSSSPEDDDDLMNSIRELGILEPLIVMETADGLEIIAGNRRFIEAGRAGLAAVPCIIKKATESMAEKIKLHENIKRLPLSHVDQGYTFAHLIKKFGMTEQQIATLVGKSIAYVSQHLSLINSDETLVQAVHDGRLNFSHARELMQCKDSDERQRLQDIIIKHGASTDVVHTWVHESNRETDNLGGPPRESYPIQREAETKIPMYPCAACEAPVSIIKLKILRLCPECHQLLFNDIDREKQKARQERHQKPV